MLEEDELGRPESGLFELEEPEDFDFDDPESESDFFEDEDPPPLDDRFEEEGLLEDDEEWERWSS